LPKRDEFLLCAPFGGLSTLLVKLAKIVEVVDVVAVALGVKLDLAQRVEEWWGYLGACGLASRRKPYDVDAKVFELLSMGEEALVVFLVGGDVPFEALEETGIWRRHRISRTVGWRGEREG